MKKNHEPRKKGPADKTNPDLSLLEERLRRIGPEAMIGKITPEVVHDLNNFLTGILGYTELLLMKKIEDQWVNNALKTIFEAAEQCKELLGNLMSLSRPDSGTVGLAEVNGLVEKTVALRNCAFRHKQIEVAKEFGQGIPALSLQASKLQKILMNLILWAEEALEAGKEGKKIIFQTSLTGQNELTIKIIQNGSDVFGRRLSRLSQPLALVKSQDPERDIGLANARQWIDDLGGTIDQEKVEGSGWALVIRLPVVRK
jgi:two-component system NtrC family sensor kinase